MALRLFQSLIRLSAWAILLAAVVWPGAALLIGLFEETGERAGAPLFSERRLGLLLKSVALAASASVLCIAISLPLVFRGASFESAKSGRAFRISALAALFCPPMVYVFGWKRVLPIGFDPHVLTVLVWALWAWPIPAAILGAAWSRQGSGMHDALRLETTPWRAMMMALRLGLRDAVSVSFLLLMVVFLADYSVPHANGLSVYATEILGIATDSVQLRDTLMAAAPLFVFELLLVVGVWRIARRSSVDLKSGGEFREHQGSLRSGGLPILYAAATWGAPAVALLWRPDLPSAVEAAIRNYGGDLFATLGVALAAASATILVALGIGYTARSQKIVLMFLIVVGLFPGAVIGRAILAAFNRSTLTLFVDHWPVIALGLASAYGWIPALALWSARRRFRGISEQASVDGCDAARRTWYVELPAVMPTLIASGVCVWVLGVVEVPITSLLRVPDYNPIPLVIIEKFHRFEDGLLAVLSVMLVVCGVLASVVVRRASGMGSRFSP